jgi:glycosyltransferase involved in cell wall biosynthesis
VGGIFPPDSGGPSKFAFEFLEFMASKSSLVQVLVTKEGGSEVSEIDNVKLIRISRNSITPVRVLKFIKQLRQISKETQNFLVVGAFLEVYFARLRKSARVVYKLPGDIVWERARNNGITDKNILDFQFQKLSFKYKVLRKLFTASIKAADAVIVPSEGLRELTKIWGVRQDKVHLVYNSVRVSNLFQSYTGIPSVDVLTICRLTPWKGVDELIRSVHELKLSLTVIGDGPEMGNLVKLAGSLHANVTFLGQLDQSEVIQVLKKSSRFVLNSEYEGLPHVLLEARESGVLCLAKEGTGSSEVITHLRDGILFGPSIGLTLTQALKHSYSTSINKNEMVAAGLHDVRSRFNQEINFGQIQDILYAE